jgi:hypothetical protein
MTKVFIATFISCLVFFQTSDAGRKSERVSDGFVGPVKMALEEWSAVSGFPYPQMPDAVIESTSMIRMGGKFNTHTLQAVAVVMWTENTIHTTRTAIGPFALNLSKGRIVRHHLHP